MTLKEVLEDHWKNGKLLNPNGGVIFCYNKEHFYYKLRNGHNIYWRKGKACATVRVSIKRKARNNG